MYPQPKDTEFPIVGKLQKTNRKVKPVRCTKRTLYIDDNGNLFAEIFGLYWKYPEQIEN